MTVTAAHRVDYRAWTDLHCSENVNVPILARVGKPILTDSLLTNHMDVTASNVRQRLRYETRAEHDAIENTLGLMQASLSPATYQHCLTKFYGFYRPVERALATCLTASGGAGVLAGRRKVSLLRQDLQHLGVTDPDATPVCTALPALTTPAAAFGCLYVLEGATLGGQIISAHAAGCFGYTALQGAAFFHGYGSQTGAMWRAFGNSLTEFAADPATDDEIVAAALSTFQTLRLWCETEDAHE